MDGLCAGAAAHAEVKEAEKAFGEQCKEVIEQLKDEEQAAKAALAQFLQDTPSAKLKNGKYLGLHTTTSTAKLTEARVETAIGAVDLPAIKKQKGDSEADRVTAAIEAALRAECTTTTSTPRLQKNAPKKLPKGKYVVTAPAAVENLCAQMVDAQGNLKKMREHKRAGKNQVQPRLEDTRKRVHEAMDALFPDGGEESLKLQPAPEVMVDGEAAELPPLPLGDAPIVGGTKKRKVVTVPGLAKPIKVKRKLDKPKQSKPKVTIESFADELSFVIEDNYATAAEFLERRGDVIRDAKDLLKRLSAPIEPETDSPATYSIAIS